jgi:hypothetical protein
LITYKIEIPFSKKMKEKLKTSNYPIFKRI